MNAVSLDDRGDWQCPEHGPGTPKRLFGAFLHCMLCGDQCEPRPSVLAAIAQKRRAFPSALLDAASAPATFTANGMKYSCHTCGEFALLVAKPSASGPPERMVVNCERCGTHFLTAEIVPELAAKPVRGAPPARNACHNRPDKSPTYLAQDGYCEPFSVPSGEWFKTAKYVEIPHVMSEDCRYDKRDTDSKCAGCRHQRGES
jgi:hypothetical protein